VTEVGDDVEGIPEGALTQALTWVGRAAQRAGEQERWLPAAGLLDTALSLAPDGAAQPDLLLSRARARVGLHDAVGAADDLAALERLLPDDGLRVAALVVAGDLARIQSNMADSEKVLGDALELARQLGDEAGELAALRSLSQTQLFAGDDRGAAKTANEALEAARRTGDRRAEAWALQHLAWSAFSGGDQEVAKSWLGQSVAAFAEIKDWGGHGWAEGLLAWVTFACGDLAEAEVIARRVLSEAERTGDAWAINMMRTLIANIRLWSGAPEEAAVVASRAVEGMTSIDDVWGLAQAQMVLGRARLATGDVTAGRTELERAVVTSHRLEETSTARLAQAVLVISLTLQLGEGEAALATVPPDGDVQPGTADELLAAIAVAYLQTGRTDEAARAVAPLLGWEEAPLRPVPASVAPWVAFVLAAAGRRDEAAEVLGRVPPDPPGTFLDDAWGAVARLALCHEPADRVQAASRARAIVDATGDHLARANVLRAIAILAPGLGVDAPPDTGSWRRMWEAVGTS
jgi:tetratricopeptide (TPR) repeat protein